jgi:hypothetical protein
VNDSKNKPQLSDLSFSRLTEADLEIITEAELKINRQHNTNHALIAYDQPSGAGQSGARI